MSDITPEDIQPEDIPRNLDGGAYDEETPDDVLPDFDADETEEQDEEVVDDGSVTGEEE